MVKVVLVELKANPVIYNLAHTHTDYNGYFDAPVATSNRDFSRIIFVSNWDSSSNELSDYMIKVPIESLP